MYYDLYDEYFFTIEHPKIEEDLKCIEKTED